MITSKSGAFADKISGAEAESSLSHAHANLHSLGPASVLYTRLAFPKKACDLLFPLVQRLKISSRRTTERQEPMDQSRTLVFLFDVDNTLLDNDRVTEDLKRYLTATVGLERQQHY